MSRLKKTIAAGAVAALSGTGSFLALGSHAAHASTPLNGTSSVDLVIHTWESYLGDVKYDCSVYAMNLMLSGNVSGSLSVNNFCGYLAGYGVGVGYGFGLPI